MSNKIFIGSVVGAKVDEFQSIATSLNELESITGRLSVSGPELIGCIHINNDEKPILIGSMSIGNIEQNIVSGSINDATKLIGSLSPSQMELTGDISKPLIINDDEMVYILRDNEGNEAVGVLVDIETVLDGTPDDVRIGKTVVTEKGITVGEKVIPGYLAHEGAKRIRPGQRFEIQLVNENQYDYTLLQCIICRFNTNLFDSMSAEKVVIDDNVYDVLSTIPIYSVGKNHETYTIDLGFVNATDESFILRYFTYKEIY